MMTILATAAVFFMGIYLFPFFVSRVIRSLPPRWLLGGHSNDRQYHTRCRVVKTFLVGLADGISFADPAKTRRYSALGPFERPFYVEGAYAGLIAARHLAPWRSRRALDNFRTQHSSFVFLLGLGAGFANGLRTWWSPSLAANLLDRSSDVDARLQPMFFDGYAFQKMVFCYRLFPASFLKGLTSAPLIRKGFYQGTGRAFWFLMADCDNFQATAQMLPAEDAAECHVGFGIASGFAGIEIIAAGGVSSYPLGIRESADFYLGLIIGLFGRYYVNPDFVERLLFPQQSELLTKVKRAAELFHPLWNNNMGYEEWRAALRTQLEQFDFPEYSLQAITKDG